MSIDVEICGDIFELIFMSLLLPAFFLFSIFHTIYDSAKILKAIELKRKVKFIDFVGEFISFCIYPIGIWFLQSNINRIKEKDQKDDLINHLIEK